MKSIRLSGLTQKTFSVLHNLRVEEMEASKRLRRIMIGVILLSEYLLHPIYQSSIEI